MNIHKVKQIKEEANRWYVPYTVLEGLLRGQYSESEVRKALEEVAAEREMLLERYERVKHALDRVEKEAIALGNALNDYRYLSGKTISRYHRPYYDGTLVDPERCAAAVHKGHSFRQCSFKRGYGPEKAFCKRHAKEYENEAE